MAQWARSARLLQRASKSCTKLRQETFLQRRLYEGKHVYEHARRQNDDLPSHWPTLTWIPASYEPRHALRCSALSRCAALIAQGASGADSAEDENKETEMMVSEVADAVVATQMLN
eukprot:6214773-Pleurochrysis_carterae.AAC.2